MMHAKNLPHSTQKFAAQAEIKGSAWEKTKKAWQGAKNAGQNPNKRVYVLIYACVLLLCLVITQMCVLTYLYKQRTGVFSRESAVRKCHQRQFVQKTTAKVSVKSTCSTSINELGQILQINVRKQCEGDFASRKVCGRTTIFVAQKSQKPSEVSDVVENRYASVTIGSGTSKGLITPKKTRAKRHCRNLRNKHRLVAEIRRRRQ